MSKFKVGDVVTYVKPRTIELLQGSGKARGAIASVSDAFYSFNDGVTILRKSAEWPGGEFELALVAPDAPKADYIVALITKKGPHSALAPVVHNDRETANKEAERLARSEPSKTFGVFQLVGTRRAIITIDAT